MKARDLTKKRTEYKGREFDCCDRACPCRPCVNIHDCGQNRKVYKDGKWDSNEWVPRMECASRFNSGCPTILPLPDHKYKSPRAKRCMRCGAPRPNLEILNDTDVAALRQAFNLYVLEQRPLDPKVEITGAGPDWFIRVEREGNEMVLTATVGHKRKHLGPAGWKLTMPDRFQLQGAFRGVSISPGDAVTCMKILADVATIVGPAFKER